MLLAALATITLSTTITRDSFGVPTIKAPTQELMWQGMGRAVAQDRLWQMDLSRRLARGKSAALLGQRAIASDREVLRISYSAAELDGQFRRLKPRTQRMFHAYTAGVNEHIRSLTPETLPKGYRDLSVVPEEWDVLDSVAIAIRLLQQFGRGGAGELRNLAIYEYLRARPATRGKELDLLDDLAWQNAPTSPATVLPADERHVPRVKPFRPFTRATSLQQLESLPRLSLLELLPAIRLSMETESDLWAQQQGLPFKMGSYAVAVSSRRSTSGRPILLAAPQMGFFSPSPVHESALQCPEFSVAGISVPGVPGIVMGHTPNLAWALTSGVADTDDIVCHPLNSDGKYKYGDTWVPLEVSSRPLAVAGGEPQQVQHIRTRLGVVVLQSRDGKYAFSRVPSHFGKELQSLESLTELYSSDSPADIDLLADSATMSFNLIYAFSNGAIGYRYLGNIPIRRPGIDPRFPSLANGKSLWEGTLPVSQMPHVHGPRGGLITNWNNKPASWWPNGDTPVWGETNRVEVLQAQLTAHRISAADVERAAWAISRIHESWPGLKRFAARTGRMRPDTMLDGFDGWMLAGSQGASAYASFLDAVRSEVFEPVLGNFGSPELFRLAIQPSLMLRALSQKTKYPYVESVDQTLNAIANRITGIELTPYSPGSIRMEDLPPIPYSIRGTYIMLAEPGRNGSFTGRSMLPPGNASFGPHAADQVNNAMSWKMKPMPRFTTAASARR